MKRGREVTKRVKKRERGESKREGEKRRRRSKRGEEEEEEENRAGRGERRLWNGEEGGERRGSMLKGNIPPRSTPQNQDPTSNPRAKRAATNFLLRIVLVSEHGWHLVRRGGVAC